MKAGASVANDVIKTINGVARPWASPEEHNRDDGKKAESERYQNLEMKATYLFVSEFLRSPEVSSLFHCPQKKHR